MVSYCLTTLACALPPAHPGICVQVHHGRLLINFVTQVAGDGEDLLLVESDEEGLAAEAGALAARRAFALQHDSLFGMDSQSQQAAPMAMPAKSAPAQVRLSSDTW